MSLPDNAPDADTEARTSARSALGRAALVHQFDPLELLPPTASPALVARTLAILARDSTEVEWLRRDGTARIMWRLDPNARRRELARLAAEGTLASTPAQPVEGDTFARYLRLALEGKLTSNDVPAADRDSAVAAAGFATDALRGTVKRDLGQVRGELRALLSQQAEVSRSRVILAGRLVGRTEERAVLDAFLLSGAIPVGDALARPLTPTVTVPVYLLTGLPGSGKSALVADLVRRRRNELESIAAWLPDSLNRLLGATALRLSGRAITKGPVVLLDLDRPAITLGGPLEWTAEVMRQIGHGAPRLASRLGEERARLRDAQAALRASSGLEGTSALAAVADLKDALATVLADEGLAGSTLLLVIDTFEEAIIRSFPPRDGGIAATIFGRLLEWADSLAMLEAGAGPLFESVRVVASGREKPPLAEAELGAWFAAHRTVGPLDPVSAAQFLRQRDVGRRFDRDRAARAVAFVGGHPLTLILLERYARNLGPEEIDAAIEKGRIGAVMGAEDATRSLYWRFLLRLHVDDDPDGSQAALLRAAAVPGLVLREVTPDLLREVVVPAAGLGQLSPDAAGRLFDRLASQYWLVDPVAGRTAVRHRPDLRRLMLPMILGDADAPATEKAAAEGAAAGETGGIRSAVLAVQQAAAAWFETRAETSGDEAEAADARLEAAYHRAFILQPSFADWLGDPASPEAARLCRRLSDRVGDDVLAMPLPSRAIIRFHGVGPLRLGSAESAALPPALREATVQATKVSELRQGRVPSRQPTREAEPPRRGIAISNPPPANILTPPRIPRAIVRQPEVASPEDRVAGPAEGGLALGGPAPRGGDMAPRDVDMAPAIREPLEISAGVAAHGLFDLLRSPELGTAIAHAFTSGSFLTSGVAGFQKLLELRNLPDLTMPAPFSIDPVLHWTWQSGLSVCGSSLAQIADADLHMFLLRVAAATDPDRARPDSVGILLMAVTTIALTGRLSDENRAVLALFSTCAKRISAVSSQAELRVLSLQSTWSHDPRKALPSTLTIPARYLRVFSPAFVSADGQPTRDALAGGPDGLFASPPMQDLLARARDRSARSPEFDRVLAAAPPWTYAAGSRGPSASDTLAAAIVGAAPELYDVVIGVFRQLDAESPAVTSRAIGETARRTPFWPADVDLSDISVRDRDRRDGAIARAVVHADRCGLLESMLEEAARVAPGLQISRVSGLARAYEALRGGRPSGSRPASSRFSQSVEGRSDMSVRVRRSIWSLPPGDPAITWYRRAVAELIRRPSSQPSSWRYLAAVHGVPQAMAIPSAAKPFWDQCQHQNWFFLPWHRGYVASFEAVVARTIVELGGPGDWALPYWDYSEDLATNPNARLMPPDFRDRRLPDGSPNALWSTRAVVPNGDFNLDASVVTLAALNLGTFANATPGVPSGFGGPPTSFNPGTGNGALENLPHNRIHTRIGGAGGFMSDPSTAALDPIFWLHHANIDRLWEVWRNMDGHHSPSDPPWLTGNPFRMHDGQDQPFSFDSEDMLDTTQVLHGYRYDGVPVARETPVAAVVEVAVTETGEPELVGENPGPTALTEDVTRTVVAVRPARAAGAVVEGARRRLRRVYLNLENITGTGVPGDFKVYVDKPDDDQEPALAGVMTTFGLERASDPGRAHGGSGLNQVLDITELAARLGLTRDDAADLRVSFEREGAAPSHDEAPPGLEDYARSDRRAPEIRVGRVSLFYR